MNHEKFRALIDIFYENHKNDNWSESLDFYGLTLYMIFQNFHENSHYRNSHFQENRENHI